MYFIAVLIVWRVVSCVAKVWAGSADCRSATTESARCQRGWTTVISERRNGTEGHESGRGTYVSGFFPKKIAVVMWLQEVISVVPVSRSQMALYVIH